MTTLTLPDNAISFETRMKIAPPVSHETKKIKNDYKPLPKLKNKKKLNVPAKVRMFDNMLNWWFEEHRIASFHLDDNRLTDEERLILVKAANRLRTVEVNPEKTPWFDGNRGRK